MEISCHFHLSDEASKGCWPIQMKEYKWKTSLYFHNCHATTLFFIGFSHIPTHSRTATTHTPYAPLYIGLHIDLCIPFGREERWVVGTPRNLWAPFLLQTELSIVKRNPPTYNILEFCNSSFSDGSPEFFGKGPIVCTEWLCQTRLPSVLTPKVFCDCQRSVHAIPAPRQQENVMNNFMAWNFYSNNYCNWPLVGNEGSFISNIPM